MLSKGSVAAAVAITAVATMLVPGARASAAGDEPATFVVTTASDGAPDGCGTANCTLREAIEAANALPDGSSSTIVFDIPGGGPVTIAPNRPLPTIQRSVTIDGTTQPGYAGTPAIEIDLSSSAALRVMSRDHFATVVVRGLAVNRSPEDGIVVEDGNFVVDRSFVGTDATGTVDRGNAGNGISWHLNFPIGYILDSVISGNRGAGVDGESGTVTVRGNRIGTDLTGSTRLPNDREGLSFGPLDGMVVDNVISGNGRHGIAMENAFYSEAPLVVGNLIGVDATGRRPLGNRGDGVRVVNGLVHIGTADEPNVVAGNRGDGISVEGGVALVIEGNRIGTDLTGRRHLGNGRAGMSLRMGIPLWPYDSWVGGRAPNHVAHNGGAGIELGEHAVDVALRSNVLHGNGGLGIDLGGDGVTLNDAGDADGGPNERQNFPVVTSATAGDGTRVAGVLDSAPARSYRVDLYTAAACDASGHGEAQRALGTFVVTTDGAGHATFDRSFTRRTGAGQVVVATATGLDGDREVGTSELSGCVTVVAG